MPNPTLSERVLQVLAAMHEQADDKGIWEGRLTELIAGLGSTSYYGKIINVMKDSGAAKQLARGGMGVPSRWQVLNPKPDLDNKDYGRAAIMRRRDRLEARLEALEQRMSGLDIPVAIADITARLDLLQNMLTRLLEPASIPAGGKQNGEANRDRPEADSTASEPGLEG